MNAFLTYVLRTKGPIFQGVAKAYLGQCDVGRAAQYGLRGVGRNARGWCKAQGSTSIAGCKARRRTQGREGRRGSRFPVGGVVFRRIGDERSKGERDVRNRDSITKQRLLQTSVIISSREKNRPIHVPQLSTLSIGWGVYGRRYPPTFHSRVPSSHQGSRERRFESRKRQKNRLLQLLK
jgi:hypothetical protein